MILLLDASAIVSMIAREDDALELSDRLDDADELLWSPVVQWEVVAALRRVKEYERFDARSDLHVLGRTFGVKLVPIGEHESDLAFQAFRLYGKGSGSPARLNMGDCFAYACAKANQAGLLYKGNDFAQTDLAWPADA